MNLVNSFNAECGTSPKLLILGSMPGVTSLEQQCYYAHPRNAFWPIMSRLLSASLLDDYPKRLTRIKHHGIALWDVLAQCQRQGSLDSAIQSEGLIYNPIDKLLEQYPSIEAVALNGTSAEKLLRKAIKNKLIIWPEQVQIVPLPSTSPANARLNFDQKLVRWQTLLNYLSDT